MAVSTTTVDLLRHGEPVGGARIRGQRDDALSERGWAQMRAATDGRGPWAAVVSSTLSRCAAFAAHVAGQGVLPLELDPRLQERGYGSWEGRTRVDIETEHPGSLARFRADPLARSPVGAEPLEGFRSRVLQAWEELQAKHTGKQVLLVGHAGVMRVIIGEVLAIPLARLFRLDVPHAALVRVEIERNGADSLPRLQLQPPF